MSKAKLNYAVVRSVFGDYWVGKTKLEPKKGIIFEDINEAIEKAKYLFEIHKGFDPDLEEEDEGYDEELALQYEDMENTTEEEVELISKGVERFIVEKY
jgi:hypothetical protein